MNRLPSADTAFNKLTDTKLISRAQSVVNGLTEFDGLYPAPPVPPEDMQAQIDLYITTAAAAIKGSKDQTASKTYVKGQLIAMLRSNAMYVNMKIWQQEDNLSSQPNYDAVRRQILQSGYELSKIPTPIGQIPVPYVEEAKSVNIGELYIRLKNYTAYKKGIKCYQVNYRPITTPVSPWSSSTFTDSRITLTDLTSGNVYEFQIAAIGGNSNNKAKITNFSQVMQKVVI